MLISQSAGDTFVGIGKNLTDVMDKTLTVQGDISASGGISIGNVGAQKGRFSVNYGTGGTMTGSLTSAGDGYGEIVQLGGTDTTAGTIYFLQTDGEWKQTHAGHVDSGSSQLLGAALGSNSSGSGMLLKGVFKHFRADYLTTGNKVYLQDANGLISGSFPTTTGNFARVVGYALSGSNSKQAKDIIYFNPDNTWVEIA